MKDNYAKIIGDNLDRLFQKPVDDTVRRLSGDRDGQGVFLTAFGEPCRINPDRIELAGEIVSGPLGIIISLYALFARPEPMVIEPLRAFREFPDTTPYHGAFASRTEQMLVAEVETIRENRDRIREKLHGLDAPASVGGDFSFVVRPLPKIALCYICYLADEQFPAAVTCLFSANANRFMPNDGLADTGEYTSKKILELVQ